MDEGDLSDYGSEDDDKRAKLFEGNLDDERGQELQELQDKLKTQQISKQERNNLKNKMEKLKYQQNLEKEI